MLGFLTIESTLGTFSLIVQGSTKRNAYGIESFVGLRVPPSVFFSPAIVLHNPHDEDLKILEVFTTGNFLQLALPEGKAGDSHYQPWDLLPHQTKTVLHLAFISNSQGRFHGFVIIKTNKGMMFLRVDLMVALGGIYVTTQKLEFHTLTNRAQKKRLRLKGKRDSFFFFFFFLA